MDGLWQTTCAASLYRIKAWFVEISPDGGAATRKLNSLPDGVDCADYDNDGYIDVFITTLSNEKYPLYRNNGDLSFTYVTNSSGVGQITLLYSGWGTRFLDVDNDGLRDLFVAQGHVLDTIEKSTAYSKYKQSPLLMRNTGKGFVNVSATAGAALNAPIAARGAAFGDLNNDGQVDVVLGVLDGPPLILRNMGTRNHWLGVLLSGSKSNRNGIGARLTVTDTGGKKQVFDVTTAGSYLSSNDPRIVVGLGAASAVRSVEVRWPSGRVQTLPNPGIDDISPSTKASEIARRCAGPSVVPFVLIHSSSSLGPRAPARYGNRKFKNPANGHLRTFSGRHARGPIEGLSDQRGALLRGGPLT